MFSLKFSCLIAYPFFSFRGFTQQLIEDVEADELSVSVDAKTGSWTVGQYDALFSLNKRRVESWVELIDHLWIK